MEPSQPLVSMVKGMFRNAWDQHLAQADDAVTSAKRQIKALEKQTDALLNRIVDTTNPSVIKAYEGKILNLEKTKLKLHEQTTNYLKPTGTYEDKLEPALQIIANPWKLWASGNITLRRLVLKLAFADRIRYDRNKGARTANL